MDTFGNLGVLIKAIGEVESLKFECQFCGRPFASKTNCKRHERIHTDDKPFKCPICLWRFTLKKNMLDHKRVHTGEQPFTCEMCARKFSRQNSLKRHFKLHTGEKPFECALCGKSFSSKAYCNRHIRSSHKMNVKRRVLQNETNISNHEIVYPTSAIEVTSALGNEFLVEVKSPLEKSDISSSLKKGVVDTCAVSNMETSKGQPHVYDSISFSTDAEELSQRILPIEKPSSTSTSEECRTTSKSKKTFFVSVPKISTKSSPPVETRLTASRATVENMCSKVLRVRLRRYDKESRNSQV